MGGCRRTRCRRRRARRAARPLAPVIGATFSSISPRAERPRARDRDEAGADGHRDEERAEHVVRQVAASDSDNEVADQQVRGPRDSATEKAEPHRRVAVHVAVHWTSGVSCSVATITAPDATPAPAATTDAQEDDLTAGDEELVSERPPVLGIVHLVPPLMCGDLDGHCRRRRRVREGAHIAQRHRPQQWQHEGRQEDASAHDECAVRDAGLRARARDVIGAVSRRRGSPRQARR